METSEEYRSLVGFTALAPLAVGGLVGLLVASGSHQTAGVDWAAMIVLASGILAFVISLFHLGRPWRAPLAMIHLASSWLSREVILFGLFLVALAGYAILPLVTQANLGRFIVGLAGAAIGLIGTVATGATYRLRARPSWDQWLTIVSFPLGALSTGSLFGFFVARRFSVTGEAAGYAWTGAALLLVLSVCVTWLRSTSQHPEIKETLLSRQLILGSYLWILIMRVVAAVVALGLIAMSGEAMFTAWIPALLGEFADRFMFFKTVVPVTFRGRYS